MTFSKIHLALAATGAVARSHAEPPGEPSHMVSPGVPVEYGD